MPVHRPNVPSLLGNYIEGLQIGLRKYVLLILCLLPTCLSQRPAASPSLKLHHGLAAAPSLKDGNLIPIASLLLLIASLMTFLTMSLAPVSPGQRKSRNASQFRICQHPQKRTA